VHLIDGGARKGSKWARKEGSIFRESQTVQRKRPYWRGNNLMDDAGRATQIFRDVKTML